MAQREFESLVPVPRSAVRFPLELRAPEGFVADQPETWPLVDGELEFVDGKLLYMPPSADRQQDTCVDVITVLGTWRKAHPNFVVAGNEAGVVLGGETRAADAAVWRRADVGAYEGKYRRVAPLLAVEVQGELENVSLLRSKARWYVSRGVKTVWLLFPSERRVIVVDGKAAREYAAGDRLPRCQGLPGLTPAVSDLFAQVTT